MNPHVHAKFLGLCSESRWIHFEPVHHVRQDTSEWEDAKNVRDTAGIPCVFNVHLNGTGTASATSVAISEYVEISWQQE